MLRPLEKTESFGSQPGLRLADALWSIGLLLAGLLVTGTLAFYEKSGDDADAARNFDFACREVEIRVDGRLDAHEMILRSGAARFADRVGVDRMEWQEFAERQRIGLKLQGIQGIGFAQLIPSSQLAQHIQQVRADGLPGYQVSPEGVREFYAPTIYLEPYPSSNLHQFGYDMLSDPVLRTAMERARDLDEGGLSGKVALMQESGQEAQAGALMYVPVYRTGEPHETVDERRAALFGWVYSPYRMNELMEGILGSWEKMDRRHIHLKIFDGISGSPGSLLYDSRHNAAGKTVPSGKMARQTVVHAAGREWLLSFSETGGSGANYRDVWLVTGGGILVSLLLSALGLSFASTLMNARRIADRLTRDLFESEFRLHTVTESAQDAILIVNSDGKIAYWNPASERIFGYTRAEALGRKLPEFLVPPRYHSSLQAAFQLFKETGQGDAMGKTLDTEAVCKDGSETFVQLSLSSIQLQGKWHAVGILRDITAHKQALEALQKSAEEFRFMFEMASIGMAQCDPETGRWLRVNAKMCEITGYSAAELLELHASDITHPADREKSAETFRQLVRGEGPLYHLEKRYLRKDGTETWVNVNAAVIRNASGIPIHVLAAVEEITARKQSEEALRVETLRRQELKQEVMDIAESEQRRIGHDLHDGICQELSGILFVAELIARRLPEELPEKDLLAKTVADIRTAILHTRHLSHSLAPIALEKNDLATALAELAADIKRVFGISCTFSCPVLPKISLGNTATHLYRIAQESIQNAIRHGKSTSIEITLLPDGAQWVLQIADNGTPTGQENKSGRGLQIMRYRASIFAGTLRIQSRKPSGTIITCTFSP